MPLQPRRALVAATVGTLVATLLVTPPSPAGAATPVSLTGAHWIWYPEGDPRTSVPADVRYFRKTFTAPAGAVSEAQLVLTGDDTVDVWVNGKPVAGSPRVADSWHNAVYVDLQSSLASGTNTIAVAARNSTAGPAGVLGRLRVVAAGGTVDLVTDGGWKAGLNVPSGWEQPGFGDGGWPAARDSGAYGISPWNSDVVAPNPDAASPLSVSSATVEHRANPLGVDAAQPRFGWKLGSSAAGQRQAAYEIAVSNTTANAGDVWSSGRVASDRQVDVVYGGPALVSLRRYYWRVRVWDAQGRPSAWSATQFFETGLRAPATEWTGDFVGQPATGADLSGATWIWYPEGDPAAGVPVSTRYFRRTFTLAAAPSSAQLVVTGDDTADVWVNGVQVSSSPRVYQSWQQAAVVDLRGRLTAGTNTIAVATENTTQSPAGMIAKLTVAGAATITTDASWKAFQSAPSGWNQSGFNDAAWPAARAVATYGSGPWGSNVMFAKAAPLVRKAFTVSKPVASARLLTTALGLHETRLNGAKVGADVLAPGWTDYTKRLQYKVYDVTGQLRQGENALGAWLGNGWYSGSLGFAGSQRYGTQPWYSAVLLITFSDGTITTVRTDNTWKVATGPIRADDLYNGETYDARLAVAGWDAPGFDDASWAAVQLRTGAKPNLVAQVDNGVTVQQEFRPVSVTQPQAGVWVFDLGQNFTGWNRVALSGPAGTTVTIRHAEVLNPDGTIYTTNLRGAQATDRFTLAGTGGTETYEPRFTVHGYRYVELTGLPAGLTPTASTVTGRAAWTSGNQSGTLTTSNALVNQLQHNILWGERSNMLSIPTDCPQRDERLGWTGDIAIFAGTSTFNVDVQAFLDKYSDDLVDAQRTDGAFTDVAPGVCCGAGTAGWGDAGVIVPYTLWQRYGDIRVVDEHFAAMARWVDYLRSTSGADLIRNQPTYGDWLNVNDNTAQDVISTAFFAWSARLVSRMAAATGRTSEAASYGQLADQVAAAFTGRFVAADGTVSGNTQTGYVLALAFGLLPANRVQASADRLAARVAAAGGHLTVGFLGVENLLPVLAANGHAATAYQILLQPGFPGWGYMNSRGATTIWERWDGIRTDGSFNDPGMNSFNHYGLGSVGDFLYRQVGGLSPASPGYASLLVAPVLGGGLTSASSSYETPYGRAVSDWSVSGGAVTLRVTVAAGAFATVKVPTSQPGSILAPTQAVPMGGGTYYVGSGSFTFTAPA
ncbi:family 78 glycoside hydrolase catalytic domain [Dactylosporangium sp. AC04546]|uniref:family 78 glycoside hydrolase catalytic domain n=1 Tax=Dactylosporangium sp. AC04546 TaxID=2862460 RepID=UPI001EE01AA9|nr:family 78 glycoside hydrolase catalytic domain [Dactylosporangium sp. AC04546]WVK83271.1 family 78 glycoside hydrolase catalytic domain [Dactylosporangium sp. AC04546]